MNNVDPILPDEICSTIHSSKCDNKFDKSSYVNLEKYWNVSKENNQKQTYGILFKY